MLHASPATTEERRKESRPLAKRWRDLFPEGAPMPATQDDITRLRSVLHMLKSDRSLAVGNGDMVRKEAIGALERAIKVLEEGITSSPVFWILGALAKSWERSGPFEYELIDADLNAWALEQLHQQMTGTRTSGH